MQIHTTSADMACVSPFGQAKAKFDELWASVEGSSSFRHMPISKVKIFPPHLLATAYHNCSGYSAFATLAED